MNDLLTPGMFVRNPTAQANGDDWGLGQVQSNINNKLTVNFEHKGKVVLASDHISLVPVFDPP